MILKSKFVIKTFSIKFSSHNFQPEQYLTTGYFCTDTLLLSKLFAKKERDSLISYRLPHKNLL
jgi:hypothetical protein